MAAVTEFVRAVLAAEPQAIDSAVSESAAFNSPIRRYERREDVLHLLRLLGTVLPGAVVERTWPGNGGAATVISAVFDEGELHGMIEELHDRHGRVREATLMLRPHSVMMPAIKRMAAALENDPLPA